MCNKYFPFRIYSIWIWYQSASINVMLTVGKIKTEGETRISRRQRLRKRAQFLRGTKLQLKQQRGFSTNFYFPQCRKCIAVEHMLGLTTPDHPILDAVISCRLSTF